MAANRRHQSDASRRARVFNCRQWGFIVHCAQTTNRRQSIVEAHTTTTLRQSGTEMDVVGGRRYVEAVPRGLLVALVPAAAAAAMANGRRGVLVPVLARPRCRRLPEHVGAAALVARLVCACLWALVVIFVI